MSYGRESCIGFKIYVIKINYNNGISFYRKGNGIDVLCGLCFSRKSSK
jgi:hypothetical protein